MTTTTLSLLHRPLVGLGALTICAGAALAVPPKLMDPSAGDDALPEGLMHALRARAAAQTARASAAPRADLSGAFGAVQRGSAGADGALSTLDAGFESLAPLPANLVNQLDTVQWGGASAGVTGRAHFSPPTAPLVLPQFGVVSDAVAGNATKKLRGFVNPPAFGPNTFFGRWARYNFYKTNTASPTQAGATRFIFRPDTGQDVRVVHDTYVNAITSLWTSEPTHVSSGFIVGRLLWGGENQTTGIGLPVGPIPDFYTLCLSQSCQWWGSLFVPCLTPAFYRSGEPYPGGAGNNVPVPVGSWFKIITETTTDGLIRHLLDRNDGHGEFVMYEAPAEQVGRVDRMAFAGGYEVDNDACYIDNLHAEGVEFMLPAPPPLECAGAGIPGQPCSGGGSGQYLDDERWLFPGPLTGQSTRWLDALSSRAVVIEDGADKAIRRENHPFNDDRYRREIYTQLPLTYASGVGPFRICIEVDIANAQFAPNSTVQAVAPASVSDGEYVSRLTIGRFDPAAPPYTPRVYVQINPDYNPIDDENTVAPYSPGPNGNGGLPVVGVDVADTGVNWTYNSRRNVCFDVTQNRDLTVSVNGVNIFVGQAFVNSIDQLHLESENNQPGAGNAIVYDDLVLTCTVLPSSMLPPFSLVYNDDLEWGIVGVTIGLHDDDCNTTTPFKWASAPNMPIVQTNPPGPSNKALRMENLFRDTPAAAPSSLDFELFTQASTALPPIVAGPTRGWVVRSDNRLTDGATSRTWASGHALSPLFAARGAALALSSVTGTFWYAVMNTSTPDPGDTTWLDSGSAPAAYGASVGNWFSLSIHRNLNQKHTFRINGALLRYGIGSLVGQPIIVDTLQSPSNGVFKNLDRLIFLGSDEDSAPVGSILYTDNIRVWSLPCLGDTNNDGIVNFTDLNSVLGFFGQSGAPNTDLTGNIAPDANLDGAPDDTIVNFADLNAVLSGFGIPCTGTN